MAIRAWAGEYNHRVTIWKNDPDREENADGQRPEDPKEICKRWASVMAVRAAERFLSLQVKQDITHAVRMRRDTVTLTFDSSYWLTLRDGTRLDIRTIHDVDDGRQELILECNQRT